MSETTIDVLRREVQTLRRSLYLALAVVGALGMATIAACAGRSVPPTKISLTDSGRSVEIDATGITITEGEHTVRITGGTLTASDKVIVVTADGKVRTSIEPAIVALYGPDASTAQLAVQESLGAELELHAGSDSKVTLRAQPTFASMKAEAEDRSIGGEASRDHAVWRAANDGGASAELSTGDDRACSGVQRGNPNPGATDAAQMCAPPQK
jgi:hypothetical protein